MRLDGKFLLITLVLIVHRQIAVADEWKVSGALDQEALYNDNIAMRADPSAVFGYLLKPRLQADWSTAVMKVGVNGSGDIRRYDDQRWDCDNFSLGANQQYLQKRHVFSVSGEYSQRCSYSQQLEDTGILVPNNQMESYSISPVWNWQVTPLDGLTLSPSYSETNYSRTQVDNNLATNVNYRNNKTFSANLSETHNWSRRLSTNVGLFYSDTEFSNAGSTHSQSVFGFQLGGKYLISRAWSVNAGGGLRWVQQPFSVNTGSDSGNGSPLLAEVGNLDLVYKGRFIDYSLSYTRSINPSAYGQLFDYSSLSSRFSYQITKELSFDLNGSISENQTIGQAEVQAANNRTYYSASTGLTWKFAKAWRLSASYRYQRQEFPDASAQASGAFANTRESNAVMLNLNYNWDGWRVSR